MVKNSLGRWIWPVMVSFVMACAVTPGGGRSESSPTASASARSAGETPTSYPPIQVHPDNPRYFLFREQPAVLISSGEHYGAVLNADFDFIRYLDELQAYGLNQTRTFAGPYREEVGIRQLPDNSLAPVRPDAYVAPWARTSQPGAADGGNKFDLNTWNPGFFDRLRSFVTEAGHRGIVVELVFFSAMYFDHRWQLSPLHAKNNINGVGHVPFTEVNTLREPALVHAQARLVAKIAQELASADNLYYEIINEPYAKTDGRSGLAFDPFASPESLQWQERMVQALVDAEAHLEHKHLIAQNVSGDAVQAVSLDPRVSVLNFHYASPQAVRLNEQWQRPVVLDETGFLGTDDAPYRRQAWSFMMAGGAGFSHLDLTFTTSRPDGSYHPLPSDAFGGGGPSLRAQLKILKDFLHGLEFVTMAPNLDLVKRTSPDDVTAYVLSRGDQAFALYLNGGGPAQLTLDLPPGVYKAEWIDTKTGVVVRVDSLAGGEQAVSTPPYVQDIALRIHRLSVGMTLHPTNEPKSTRNSALSLTGVREALLSPP